MPKMVSQRNQEYGRRYYQTHKEVWNLYYLKHEQQIKEYQARYRQIHKKKLLAYNKRWRKRNVKKCKENSKRWANNNRELTRLYKSRWEKKHPDKANAKVVARQISKLQATPLWLSEKHKQEIVVWYSLAQETNLTVDHIIPLKGKSVCGLHVPWNLQLLTRSENASKSNRLIT